jgi:hypothetical protein
VLTPELAAEYLQRPMPDLETQEALKRVGRLYRNSLRYWPSKAQRTPFDKGLSGRMPAWWKYRVRPVPDMKEKLIAVARADKMIEKLERDFLTDKAKVA